MRAQFGWDIGSWYGQFVTVAAGVLGSALFALFVAALILFRYEARLASGAIHPPALRTLTEAPTELVLGASIGDIPGPFSHVAFRKALASRIPDLPWARLLVRRHETAGGRTAVALFFPTTGIAEAFALCGKLADIPPQCMPTAVPLRELRREDGTAATLELLSRWGIGPYRAQRSRTRVVSNDADARRTAVAVRADLQPPLALRRGVARETLPDPSDTFWLSANYRRGDPKLVDVVAAGDVMMGSIGLGLNPQIRRGTDAARLTGTALAAIFRHADIAFANLEGPLYDGPDGTAKDCANCFSFHSPPFYAGVLANLGLDVVSLANNHSGDYGEAGRASTIRALKANGIAYAGLDRAGARAATLILPGGRRVAVTAFAPNSGTLNLNNIPAAQALIRALKADHDLVIVSFHGGAEGWDHVHVPKAEEYFYGEDRGNVERFAHAAIDAGADLVIGQGPHVPRAVELYRGHLIAYSLGNFWTYTGVNSYAVSGLAPVLEAWLQPNGQIAGFTIHSARQAGLGVPHRDPLREAERYMLYLTRSDFPRTADRLDAAGQSGVPVAARGEGGSGRTLTAPGS